jgi:hypothetical protein
MAHVDGSYRDYDALGRRDVVLEPPQGLIRYKYIDMRDNDEFAEMGMCGGVATAKSTAALDFLLRRALEYPGSNILIARATLTSLKSSTLTKLTQRLGAILESSNEHEAIYRMPMDYHPMTGANVQSVIKAIGLDRADLEQVFKSTEFHTGFIEEGDEVESTSHDLLQARLRQVAFHRTKKVYHLAMAKAEQWGLSSPEEAYEIMLADPRHVIGQMKLDWEDPMPGPTVLKTVWNPNGNDHLWQRYMGVPYPDPFPTPQWVEQNVGIREVHIDPKTLVEEQFHFKAGSIVSLPGGDRAYAAGEDAEGKNVKLIDGRVVPRTEAGLIVQRAAIYAFKDENASRNFQNDENSYLMVSRDLRRRAFIGAVDQRSGRVFPGFIDDYVENGGHLLRWPGSQRIAQAMYRGFGGIDQGGRHATAMVAGVISPESMTAIIYGEYMRQGVAARESAYDALGLVLPGAPEFWWGHDPAMAAKEYGRDTEYSTLDEYAKVLSNLLPGDRGEAAYDYAAGLLGIREAFIGERPRPKLLVFDNCVHVRETLNKLTWKMVRMQRDMWYVDVGDALKIAMSMYRRMVSTGLSSPKVYFNDGPIQESRSGAR